MADNSYIDYRIDGGAWADIDCEALAASCSRALATAFPLEEWPVYVLFSDDAAITKLNRDFRNRDGATNVLSFPPDRAIHNNQYLGDVILAYETCREEATAAKKSLENHATHLLIHGVLHLLGFDHENDKDAHLMEEMEIKLLATIGIDDPYCENIEKIS